MSTKGSWAATDNGERRQA